jgi:DNA invertase Pin-like site-specific DNA recombinase
MVTRFGRNAQSTPDLLNTLAAIGHKPAGFRSLADAWGEATTAHGRLILTVLGGLAEFERELIRARTGEGRGRAVAKGVGRRGLAPQPCRYRGRLSCDCDVEVVRHERWPDPTELATSIFFRSIFH